MASAAAEDGNGERAALRPSRNRKQVEFFSAGERPTSSVKSDIDRILDGGAGTALKEIPNVAYRLGKVSQSLVPDGNCTAIITLRCPSAQVHRKDELLKVVHRLLFKSPGTFTTIKPTILKFAGFPRSDDAAADAAARRDRATKLRKLDVETLGRLGELFDVHRAKSGTKDERIDRILDFLDTPQVGMWIEGRMYSLTDLQALGGP